MEWEDKIKMVQLGNKMNGSDDNQQDKIAFWDYVLEKLDSFDGQAWDMFCNIVEIIVPQMKADIEIWKKVYPHFKKIDPNDKLFGLRTGMRVALIQTVCEDELLLK